MTQDHGDNPPH